MSGALSIFQKACPSCAASVAVDTVHCACGYAFEAAGGAGTMSDDEAALRDEELYENYLAARAGQAAEAARAAADWLAEEPDNSDRGAAAQLAQEVAKSLEADLNEQRAKIAALRHALGPRPLSTPPARSVVAAAPKPVQQPKPVKPIVSKPAVLPAAVAQPRASTPPAALKPQPAPSSGPAPGAVATASARAPTASTEVALPPLSSAHTAAAALEAIKRAKMIENAATEPQAPAVSATAPESFRAEQSARASRVVAGQPAAPANSKDCPNCTASVPLAATRCRCGYAFVTSSNDLPTLTLCTGDFTALRNSLKLNLGK